jgi:PAS domain S-box-containing protein
MAQDELQRRTGDNFDAFSRLLRAVGSAVPLSVQLDDLVKYVEGLSVGMRCSILLVDAEHKVLRVVAAPSLPQAYNEAIDGAAYAEGVGSCGTAAARCTTVVVPDIDASPLWADYRDLARRHGLKACWSTPILTNGEVLLGTFAMYYDECREPSTTELAHLQIAGPLAAIVIQRHREAAHLRESEDRFAAVFEFAAIGMALLSPDGRFRRVNRALCRIVGYSDEELLRTTFQALTHPYDLSTDLHLADELLQGKRTYYDMEKRYIHKEGHTIWILLSVSLLRREDGAPIFFMSQIQDITERKRLQQLLGQVATSEQQKLSRELHDGLGQELTGLSLLARAFANKAERAGSPLAKDATALSELAMSAVATCKDIVRGVSPLTESKGGFIEGVEQLVERASELSGQRLQLAVSAPVPLTLDWYSSNQLYRIAQEAINNAIAHAQASLIIVQIEGERHRVKLRVIDNGRGLPAAGKAGAGIGFGAMRHRAAVLRGILSIESNPAGGTIVYCECPLDSAGPLRVAGSA